MHRGDRRRGRFLHQPVAGVRHEDFLHVRRRVADDMAVLGTSRQPHILCVSVNSKGCVL